MEGHEGEHKYYFAWWLDALSLEESAKLAHTRWVIERLCQDAKDELGLDDYEGRLWTGFHRHAALVMLAHSYLTLRQGYGPRTAQVSSSGAFPEGPTERGSSQKGRSSSSLHPNHRDAAPSA